jgi:hypothetical protein
MKKGVVPVSISYAAGGKYARAGGWRARLLVRVKVARPGGRFDCHWNVYRTSRPDTSPDTLQGATMLDVLDVILLAVGLGFFALSIAYAYACERL